MEWCKLCDRVGVKNVTRATLYVVSIIAPLSTLFVDLFLNLDTYVHHRGRNCDRAVERSASPKGLHQRLALLLADSTEMEVEVDFVE